MRSQLDSFATVQWIELAFKAKFKPSELAQLCNVSLRQLERYFDEAFRDSPKYWLHQLRLCASTQLIMQMKSEKEIAFALSFSNVPHFVREFKRRYGCTPKSYLRIEGVRLAIRSEASPEWRTLEEDYRRGTLHPRDKRTLLMAHSERTRILGTHSNIFRVEKSDPTF